MSATSKVHGVARLRLSFSTNLREAMHVKGMSQSDLARAVFKEERPDKKGYAQPVGKDRISAYVNGRVLPTQDTLDKIASALDTTPAQLMGEKERPEAAAATTVGVEQRELRIEPRGGGKLRVSITFTSVDEHGVDVTRALMDILDKYEWRETNHDTPHPHQPRATLIDGKLLSYHDA